MKEQKRYTVTDAACIVQISVKTVRLETSSGLTAIPTVQQNVIVCKSEYLPKPANNSVIRGVDRHERIITLDVIISLDAMVPLNEIWSHGIDYSIKPDSQIGKSAVI